MFEKRSTHVGPSILTGVVASSVQRGLKKCYRLKVQTQEYGPSPLTL